MSIPPLLLCTDLDQTLLPNGAHPESPQAWHDFQHLLTIAPITLVFVTGRSLALVITAIEQYALPLPTYIISDVGTNLYCQHQGQWQLLSAWHHHINCHWPAPDEIKKCLALLPELTLQASVHQGDYKVSYLLPICANPVAYCEQIQQQLLAANMQVRLIYSADVIHQTGLLDIVPNSASKRHAIEFLQQLLGYTHHTTLFAGDSGNDLEVLASSIPAVLVANAAPQIRHIAQQHAQVAGCAAQLYCAQGGWRDYNGNYSAGILEGIAHFRPDIIALINEIH
ncbi:HAD hydrolase family protein [Rhodoferax sp. 4810]|uniref:HAD hydrolase family protein n=1 Tax=Thiospirillum jenense TaxID=1653858 RepID=A0A839HCR7_9GAMM|nr:HAD family hydrolase [Thiospirillum jenense]MBB1073839.1 HAD hydrolase family protein [Rhodoferax jenense]MBB1125206.1 HAD hydrolase family protein [Thiospirillum jenense]